MKINRWRKFRRRYHYWRNKVRELPLLAFGGAPRVGALTAGRFRIRQIELSFPGLPTGLDGFTITHLTDLHFGINADPRQHLPPVIEACEQLASDVIAITGDWIDHENIWLEPALPLLAKLSAPLGIFGCLGNHDFRDNKFALIKRLQSWQAMRLLINDAAILESNGARFGLIGLDYAFGNTRWRRHLRVAKERLAAQAKIQGQPDFLLTLAHDPDLWDPLREQAGSQLVLSGHTHGSQISLTPEPKDPLGPATPFFKYVRGLHEKDGSYLNISNGLAQTIPVRWNCPTEVVQIKLRAA